MDEATQLRLDIKSMLSQYNHYFTRAPHTHYWLVVVDNHFEDCYSFFIYMQRFKAKLTKSYEIACFKRNKDQYEHFLSSLKQHSNLSIEYRDTNHLILPDTEVQQDLIHGHSNLKAFPKIH
ncbi:hypothetical protein [Lacticaseibacillus paracasei]|uniref:hypothetical protein n=1 Tax=Lacticaseibacillus paracasei TaxID=1597 RepID=UPI0031F7061C